MTRFSGSWSHDGRSMKADTLARNRSMTRFSGSWSHDGRSMKADRFGFEAYAAEKAGLPTEGKEPMSGGLESSIVVTPGQLSTERPV